MIKIGENACNVKFSDLFIKEIKELINTGKNVTDVSKIMCEHYKEYNLKPKKFRFYIYNLIRSDRFKNLK